MSHTETIYVALLDEGVEVWRPVLAVRRAQGLFEIVSKNDSQTEAWEFPSGSLVRCETKQLSEGSCLVAIELKPPWTPKVLGQ